MCVFRRVSKACEGGCKAAHVSFPFSCTLPAGNLQADPLVLHVPKTYPEEAPTVVAMGLEKSGKDADRRLSCVSLSPFSSISFLNMVFSFLHTPPSVADPRFEALFKSFAAAQGADTVSAFAQAYVCSRRKRKGLGKTKDGKVMFMNPRI